MLSLLTASMERNDQRCIRCVHEGTTVYIRLVTGGRRAITLRNVDDVLRLVENVSESVSHVTKEDLPDAIARLVESRARTQGTDAPPRIAIVPRVGMRENIIEQTNATRELQTLTTQMAQTHCERKRIREQMTPVRKNLRDSERKLCDAVRTAVDSSVGSELDEVVQMHTSKKDGSVTTRTVSISTTLRPQKRNIFGIRNVCRCVREAVTNIQERDETFDARLRTELMTLIEDQEHTRSQTWTRAVVVKRKRHSQMNETNRA